MNKPMRKTHPLMKIMNKSLIDLPTPSNISMWWNLGVMLSTCLIIQISSGIMLTMHYSPHIYTAFNSIIHILRDVNNGWFLYNLHSNGASLFFICLYLHMGRGIYYSLFKSYLTWMVGTIMLLLSMMTAFLGYVLPWGQMSFWGATVITNLLSAIPYLGINLVEWLWGGFSMNSATLMRFFTIHFTLPFILSLLLMIHLLFLHQTGSNNPLGLNSNLDKIPFHPYFSLKDLMSTMLILMMFIPLSLMEPYLMFDPENMIPGNPLVTPTHIQPEWYFLFAYTILRSMPNKLGGVIMMISSILIFMILPVIHKPKFQSSTFYPLNQIMFWLFLSTVMLLTWIGSQPAESPYILISQIFTIFYFMFFILNFMMTKFWDNLI